MAVASAGTGFNQTLGTASTTTVVTPSVPLIAGHVVLVAVLFSDTTTTVSTIAGNTTAGTATHVPGFPISSVDAQTTQFDLWWLTGAVGSTLTVTTANNATPSYWDVYANVLTGADTVSPLGAKSTAAALQSTATYTARSGTATPTETGDFALAYYMDSQGTNPTTITLNSTISPSYTLYSTDGGAVDSAAGGLAVSGTAAQEAGWNITGATTPVHTLAVIQLIKPAGGGGARPLSGTGAVTTSGAAALSQTQALKGTGAVISGGTASLTNATAPKPLAGTGAIVSGGSGALSTRAALASTGAIVTGGTGAARQTQPLAGTGAVITAGSSSLTNTAAAGYYISAAGLDTNNGTSSATPFQTIDRLNNFTLNPGDHVYLRRGDTFTVSTSGGVNSNFGGTTASPIVWDAYGTGAQPIISGGASFTGGWAATGTANVYSIAQASYVGGLLYGGVWAIANRNNGGTGTIATLAAMNTPSWWWSGGTLYLHTPDSLATANGKAIVVNNQAGLLNIDVSGATNKGPVKIQNIEFRHSSDATLYLNGFTGAITVSGCTFKYCGWGTSETTGQGAVAYISNSTGSGRVTGCTFDSIEATPLYATNAPQVDFDNNTVTNITGSWLTGGANGVEYEAGSTGGNVYNNSFTMTNVGPSGVTNQSPKGAITYAGTGTPGTSLASKCYGNVTNGGAWGISASNCNIDVHDNLCQNHTGTTEINYAAGLYFGPGFSSVPTVDNVRLFRNRVVNCRYSIYLAGDAGVVYTGLLVAHNTFVNTSAQQGNIYAALPVAGIFENNIYSGPSDTGYLIALAAGVTSGKTLTQDYELVGANRAGGFNLNGTTYATLATYLAATNAASTHGVVGNPLFVAAPGNLALGSGSPAIDAGVVIAGINDGTAGSTRYLGTAPDIGYAEVAATQALAGSGAVVSGGTATLTNTGNNALAGMGTITSSGSAALAQMQTLTATGAAVSGGTATLSNTGNNTLSGTGATIAGGTASLAQTQALYGTGAVISSGTAQLAQTQALAGNGALVSGGTAALTQTQPLAGTGAITSAGTASLSQTQALAGSGGAVTGGSAALTNSGSNALAGSGGVVCGGAAALSQTQALAGSGGAVSGGTGSLTQSGVTALSGTGAITSGGTASVTNTGNNSLAASGNLLSGGTGILTTLVSLSGTGTTTTGGSAALTVANTNALAGVGHLIAGGAASLGQIVILTATGAVVSGGSGALSQVYALGGVGAVISGGTAGLILGSAIIPAQVLTSDDARSTVTTSDEARTLVLVGDAT